ncbi:phage recombination protein Bet [Streptomyces caniscabiei]|uniref:phage recombination protein Bet n=1 Tax=Streptomyces caniscabiei TaxID=2746961 RepID=UPI0007660C9C|nr:phage recombination protein Bet [Streptomyces caniscabiei]
MSAELTKAGGALAIRPDQTDWTEEQALVLRQSGIDNDVTKAELAGFLHLCQRTRLDPFSRQIYLIGRWDKKQQRKVFTPQTGIDGYRVVAQRAAVETGSALGYEDTLWCGEDGRWRDVWLAAEPPAAAKVTVLRDGHRFSAVALFREYVQTNRDGSPVGMWMRMPSGQLAKCASALALRMAFPHDLAGVYTAEEMAQADNPTGGERHLRKVQPDEGDPWASPPPERPEGPVAVKGRSQPAQDFATAAARANDPAEVKDVYRQARDEGLLTETVKVDRELLELGAYLIARGKQLAAPASQPTPAEEPGEVIEGEIVETGPEAAEADAATAEQELRAAAAKVGLDNLDEEFEKSFGIPIAQAPAVNLRQMTGLLTGSAA